MPTRNLKVEDCVIELLGPGHDREGFSCGERELDDYLRTRARQDVRRHAAAVFILRRQGSKAVAGYYSLSSTAVPLAELPLETAKRLPRYPVVPATLLGRLAVDASSQGSGFGQHLLMDALRRSLQQSREIASAAVIVDAKHTKARDFYRRYDFIAFPGQQLRLFLPMATIAEMFPAA